MVSVIVKKVTSRVGYFFLPEIVCPETIYVTSTLSRKLRVRKLAHWA